MSKVYQTITDTIIRQIEAGAGKFEMPWHTKGSRGGSIYPVNAKTGTDYNGMNVITMWAAGKAKSYTSNVWATYRQWQELGAQVRKGEKSTHGIYWKEMSAASAAGDDQQDTPARPGKRLVGFGFSVFCADQVDGWDGSRGGKPVDRTDRTARLAHADAVIAGSGASITHEGIKAFYRPSTDQVHMPERWRFIGTATADATTCYYSTLLHELTHWTGHESRLNRERVKRFGDEAYAFEELIAEIGAAFACARLGIENEPRIDHAAYVQSWLKVLRNDPRAIITAASKAQKACDFIVNRLAAPAAMAA